MKWFNVGMLAIGLGMLFIPSHFPMVSSRPYRFETYEVDQISILSVEVLSDETIMLQIKVEPTQPSKPLLPKYIRSMQLFAPAYRQQSAKMN